MELSIQERLKDLRVERGLTLEQLEEQVNLSKSALGSYEAKDFKDISHYRWHPAPYPAHSYARMWPSRRWNAAPPEYRPAAW